MRKKLFPLAVVCLSALILTACSDSGDSTPSSSVADRTAPQTEPETIPEVSAEDFIQTVGVWTYRNDIIFHSSDGKRYSLIEDNSGIVKDSEGKSYSIQECDYRLYAVMNLQDGNLTLREGRYSDEYLNSKDYPDGYKTMIITYAKSDKFDLNQLEEALKNPDAVPEAETETETKTETEAVTEQETQTETETVTETELESESASETESESETDAETQDYADKEYAAIYQKVQDFLETDNFKQKDPNNRALEVFNYLHNQADANIQQDSITNDTAKNEVSFKCYEKYIIIINTADSTIRVEESES